MLRKNINDHEGAKGLPTKPPRGFIVKMADNDDFTNWRFCRDCFASIVEPGLDREIWFLDNKNAPDKESLHNHDVGAITYKPWYLFPGARFIFENIDNTYVNLAKPILEERGL